MQSAVAYYSVTGQTRRFIKKTNLTDTYEVDDSDPYYNMGRNFVLIVPAYDDNMMGSVVDFLDYGTNPRYFQGVIGTGNRNFNELFVHTAKKISKKYNVPLLYAFEFNGTLKDVEKVEEVVNNIGS